MKPTIGRIVIYNTTEQNRIRSIGNSPKQLPAIIVAVWSDTCVNLKVINDGYGPSQWITSSLQGDGENQWNWPVIEK